MAKEKPIKSPISKESLESTNKLSDKEMDALAKKLNAKGIIILSTPEAIPCEKELAGEHCDGHNMSFQKKGISSHGVTLMLVQILQSNPNIEVITVDDEDE